MNEPDEQINNGFAYESSGPIPASFDQPTQLTSVPDDPGLATDDPIILEW